MPHVAGNSPQTAHQKQRRLFSRDLVSSAEQRTDLFSRDYGQRGALNLSEQFRSLQVPSRRPPQSLIGYDERAEDVVHYEEAEGELTF